MPGDPTTTPAAETAFDREATNRETPESAWPSAVTPADHHFVRSHFPVPALDPAHVVAVDGLASGPRTFALADLRAGQRHTRRVTLECAGNGRVALSPPTPGEPWGEGAVATALWTGVPLASLLRPVRDDAAEVVFEGADGFVRSLPLDEALADDVLLATGMNGVPIPPLHGGPLRLIVPGWYGMASVKWLKRIIVTPTAFDGWFQRRRYVFAPGEPVTRMRVKSLIVAPRANEHLRPGAVLVWGWAWSGSAAVTFVELSVDAGAWIPARLDRAGAIGAWQRFWLRLDLAAGVHLLRARARDAAGAIQPEIPRWNELGYGANATVTRGVRVG